MALASLLRKKVSFNDMSLGLNALCDRFEGITGGELTEAMKIIAPEETFREWCLRLAAEGLEVDNKPFRLDNRKSMWFIYDQIPTTIDEAYGKTVALMKCAQVGFTVMEMLAAIYMAIKFMPLSAGMFLPDMKLAGIKSSLRFLPIIRTIPAVYNMMMGESEVPLPRQPKRAKTEGNVLTRTLGKSKFFFLWTTGKSMTESNPMDFLSFDEVQNMLIADMEKARERLSASLIKFTLMGSTAKWEDADIHYWYIRGDQHQFHTRCPACKILQVMTDHFPGCISYNAKDEATGALKWPTAPAEDYIYTCYNCHAHIADTQDGEWIPRNPKARIRSLQYHQMLSPTISAREMIEAYRNAEDMQNFYNRKLGLPYNDPSLIPVNLAMLNECAAQGMAMGLEWKQRAKDTFMGIDQMGAFNVVVIKERLPDGRQAVVHLEYIYDDDPFARCDILMKLYGVSVCVVETLPNYNDAKRFAGRHMGRVFLASYGDIEDDMLRWGDSPLNRADRKTSESERDRYTVKLDQYKCMQVSMIRFVQALCLFPDPSALVQEVLDKGIRTLVPVCKDLAFLHFTKTALVTEKDDEQKLYRRKVIKVGIDPHTSYANMLCDAAYARAHGNATFLIPPESKTVTQKSIEEKLPGISPAIVDMVQELPPGEICGNCKNYDAEGNQCNARAMIVRPRDPGCILFSSNND